MRKILIAAIGFVALIYSIGHSQRLLTLEESIETALKNNWSYRNAIWANKSAGNDLWSAWGRFLPSLDFNFSNSSLAFGPNSPIIDESGIPRPGTPSFKTKSYSAGFYASQVLFDGGANIFNLSSKLAAKGASDYSLLYNKQNLVFTVKQSYFDLIKSIMLLKVQEEVLKRSEQQLKIAQTRFELGSASKSDFLKAKVQLGRDKLSLLQAQNQVQVSRANLNAVMGQSPDQDFEVQEELGRENFSLSYEECVDQAYKNNPLIRQRDHDIDAAEGQMRAARGAFLPRVAARGDYTWRGSALDDISGIWDKDYQWGVGLSVSFNIFEGFQTQNTYLNSRNSVKIAKENQASAKSEVALEVKQSFLAIEEGSQSITVTEQNVEAAEEDLNLVQEKYRLGAASILELLDAQVSFQTANSDQIQALFDYNLAVARLERAIGK